MTNALSKSQVKSLNASLAARQTELATDCRSEAQRAAVEKEIARLQGILANGYPQG